VKILEIDSERRRLSLSVKRVEDQLEHIKTATASSAPVGGAPDDIGEVPDLGLSEDVFAGPDVSGAADLRAAMQEAQAAEAEVAEAPDAEVADEPEAEAADAPEEVEPEEAEPAAEGDDAAETDES
jgi:small subunit ribosomal protein S1